MKFLRLLACLVVKHGQKPHHVKGKCIVGSCGLKSDRKPGEFLLMAEEYPENGRCRVKVPKGYFAVYVGNELRRFVVPASYLSIPEFQALMEKAAEEFGFRQQELRIPCEEDDFEKILLSCLAIHNGKTSKRKRKGIKHKSPLLQ